MELHAWLPLLLLSAAGIASAGCATDAYANACAHCFVNATTPQAMETCQQELGASVMTCYIEQYPLTMVAEGNKNCSEFDACINQSGTCIMGTSPGARYCGNSNVSSCLGRLDSCVASADNVCRIRGQEAATGAAGAAVKSICPCGSGFVLLAFACVFLVTTQRVRGKEENVALMATAQDEVAARLVRSIPENVMGAEKRKRVEERIKLSTEELAQLYDRCVKELADPDSIKDSAERVVVFSLKDRLGKDALASRIAHLLSEAHKARAKGDWAAIAEHNRGGTQPFDLYFGKLGELHGGA